MLSVIESQDGYWAKEGWTWETDEAQIFRDHDDAEKAAIVVVKETGKLCHVISLDDEVRWHVKAQRKSRNHSRRTFDRRHQYLPFDRTFYSQRDNLLGYEVIHTTHLVLQNGMVIGYLHVRPNGHVDVIADDLLEAFEESYSATKPGDESQAVDGVCDDAE
jgi:hypothetical protein